MHYLPRFTSILRPHNAHFFHQLDHAGGAVVAHAQAALQKAGRGFFEGTHDLDAFFEQGVHLVARGFGIEGLFFLFVEEDFVADVLGLAQSFHMGHHAFHVVLAQEGALHAAGEGVPGDAASRLTPAVSTGVETARCDFTEKGGAPPYAPEKPLRRFVPALPTLRGIATPSAYAPRNAPGLSPGEVQPRILRHLRVRLDGSFP